MDNDQTTFTRTTGASPGSLDNGVGRSHFGMHLLTGNIQPYFNHLSCHQHNFAGGTFTTVFSKFTLGGVLPSLSIFFTDISRPPSLPKRWHG